MRSVVVRIARGIRAGASRRAGRRIHARRPLDVRHAMFGRHLACYAAVIVKDVVRPKPLRSGSRALASLFTVGLLACDGSGNPTLAEQDGIYVSANDDGVECAALVDEGRFPADWVFGAMDRARDEHRIVQLFSHDPGKTVTPERLEAVLGGAEARGLRFYTYRELAEATEVPAGGGVVFSFDDWYTYDWIKVRGLLDAHGVRATFFVSDYDKFTAQQKIDLRLLADDGHDIEYHSTRHQDAPKYVAEHGMDEYLRKDIEPALAAMKADGYDPIVFAYPLGHRTEELDRVLLERFALLRATSDHCPR
jgi:hypothetical protein